MGNKHTDFRASYEDQEEKTTNPVEHDDSYEPEDDTDEPENDTEHSESKKLNDGELPEEPHSDTIVVTTPVDDIEDLRYLLYLETLLREENLEDPTPFEERTDAQEKAINRKFDSKVLKYATTALTESGIPLDAEEWPISEERVLTLVLQYTRGTDFRGIAKHLSDEDDTPDESEIERGFSKSSIWEWKDELSPEQVTVIEHAAIRIAHTVYRRGVPFPEEVWNELAEKDDKRWPVNPAVKKAVEEGKPSQLKQRVEAGEISQQAIDAALDNWAELFIEECLIPALDFDRTEPKYPVTTLIGMCAYAASSRSTLRGTRKSAGRWVGYEPVSNENTVLNPIRSSNYRAMDEMFQNARANFFDFASAFDVLINSKLVTFDLTDLPSFDTEMKGPWVKGNATIPKGRIEQTEAPNKWEYGVVSLANPKCTFAVGLFPFGADLNQADLLARTLRPALRDYPFEIENLVMDREFYAKPVPQIREFNPDNWVILAKTSGDIKDIREEAGKDEEFINIAEHDKYDILNDLDEKPNVIVVPLHERESNTEFPNWVFISDMDKDDVDYGDLKETYKNRNRIEKTIGQLKADFNVPHRKDASFQVNFFSMNMSVMFYNLYILINNSISPRFGYPLGKHEFVSPEEVLDAISDVAFTKAQEAMRNQ